MNYLDAAAIYQLALVDPYGDGSGTLLAGSDENMPFEELLRALERGDSSAVAGVSSLPRAFSLSQNYPNPFNPSTTISYTLPEGMHRVSLEVFDIRGRMVRTLVDREQEQGAYNVVWDGSSTSGQKVASGVYFSRLRAGSYSSVRKMVLVK